MTSITNAPPAKKTTPEPWAWTSPRAIYVAVLFVLYPAVLFYALVWPPEEGASHLWAMIGGSLAWITSRIEIALRDRLGSDE